MSEKDENRNVEEQSEQFRYQWNYSLQNQHEKAFLQKKKKRSVLTFSLAMLLSFLLCFGAIAAALFIDDGGTSNVPVQNVSNNTEQVVAKLLPQTVLISAAVDGGVSYGTGFFIRESGYIATNYHIVEGADVIEITLYSGMVKRATVVGYSYADDLAVLKISGNYYPTVTIGTSATVFAGTSVIAVGNPSGSQYSWTVTQGIVSNPYRTIVLSDNYEMIEMDMMQFDATVNGGNSGGPLCNLNGEVIGIVTRKHNSLDGIAMAIPIDGAMEILNAIIQNGNANGVVSSVSRTRPLLGITGTTIHKGEQYYYNDVEYTAAYDGVLIVGLSDVGAAIDKVCVGDILITFAGVRTSTMEDLTNILYSCKPGQTVALSVWRNGSIVEMTLTFASRR